MTAAVDTLSIRSEKDVQNTIGSVVIYLPQRVSRHAAALLTGLAAKTDVSIVAALTGDERADAEVTTSITRLGVELDASSPPAPAPIASVERTRFFTASDADEEVREAVRAVVDAARAGTPLDRVAILHASPEPYDRLIREQLIAAGIPVNGATEVPVAARLAGRTLLQLLELPSLGFRRQDVFALLTSAPVRFGDRFAPVNAWERLSRDAGVVSGRDHWDKLLLALSTKLEAKAVLADEDPERARWQSEKPRGDAIRAGELRSFMLDLIDRLESAAASPQSWSSRANWARELLDDALGGGRRRDPWPAVERKAAERVELALERLAALDQIEPTVDLDVFSRTLAIELESDLGRIGRFGEGVFVGSVGMGVGLDLDLVILLGLAEGSFPAPVHDDSLLPDSERAAANGELVLRGQRIEREHRQFLATLAGATRISSASRVVTCDEAASGSPHAGLSRSLSVLAGSRWWTNELFNSKADWVKHIASFDAGIRRLSFPATAEEHRLRRPAGGSRVPRRARGRVRNDRHHHLGRCQGARRSPQSRVHPLRRQPRRSCHPVSDREGLVRDEPGAVGRLPTCLFRPEPARRGSGREP